VGKLWTIVKHAIRDFIADDAMSLGGALAFYTALSMAPLLVLVLAVAGFLWQEEAVRAELVRQIQNLIGPSGAETVETIMQGAGLEQSHGIATIFGIATLLFGATGVFAQLQYSLNRVWNVETKPGEDVADFLRKRLLSLGMILAIAFLLVVSLVVSAVLRFVGSRAHIELPGGDATWAVLNFLASLVVYTGIFTLIHHVLPDVKMAWKDSLIGGAVTAVLFAIGKEILGWYLGSKGIASAYGAAGSFFVVLVWVYYSSLILFVGAELTQAFANEMGHRVEPDAHARFMRKAVEGGPAE
jgi:membrane protein